MVTMPSNCVAIVLVRWAATTSGYPYTKVKLLKQEDSSSTKKSTNSANQIVSLIAFVSFWSWGIIRAQPQDFPTRSLARALRLLRVASRSTYDF